MQVFYNQLQAALSFMWEEIEKKFPMFGKKILSKTRETRRKFALAKVEALLVWLLLRSNDPHCNLFSRQRRKIGSRERSPQNIFETTPLQSKGNAFFEIKGALQEGHFRSFVEKGTGPDIQEPP